MSPTFLLYILNIGIDVRSCTLLSKLVNSTKDQSEAERDRDNNLHDDAVALLHNEVKLYSIKYLNNLSNA